MWRGKERSNGQYETLSKHPLHKQGEELVGQMAREQAETQGLETWTVRAVTRATVLAEEPP